MWVWVCGFGGVRACVSMSVINKTNVIDHNNLANKSPTANKKKRFENDVEPHALATTMVMLYIIGTKLFQMPSKM